MDKQLRSVLDRLFYALFFNNTTIVINEVNNNTPLYFYVIGWFNTSFFVSSEHSELLKKLCNDLDTITYNNKINHISNLEFFRGIVSIITDKPIPKKDIAKLKLKTYEVYDFLNIDLLDMFITELNQNNFSPYEISKIKSYDGYKFLKKGKSE